MKAIDHINRYVSDVDKFIAFYRDILQYELIGRGIKGNGQNYAILKGDGHEMFISEREGFSLDRDQNFRHIGYFIENADELLRRLKLKGYVKEEQEVIVKPFSRQIYINDPDGFEIDLIQWTDKQGFYSSLKNSDTK